MAATPEGLSTAATQVRAQARRVGMVAKGAAGVAPVGAAAGVEAAGACTPYMTLTVTRLHDRRAPLNTRPPPTLTQAIGLKARTQAGMRTETLSNEAARGSTTPRTPAPASRNAALARRGV